MRTWGIRPWRRFWTAQDKGLTVDEIVRTYAGKNNPAVSDYQAYVRARVPVEGGAVRENLSPEQWQSMRKWMRAYEGAKPGRIIRSTGE